MSGPKHGNIYDSSSGASKSTEYFDYKGSGNFHHTDIYPDINGRFSYDHDGLGNRWGNHFTDQENNISIPFGGLDGSGW